MVLFSSRSLAQWKAKSAGSIVDPKDSATHTYDGAVFIPGGYPLASPLSPAPSTSHVVIHSANELHLGEASPTSFVALATLVKAELDKIVVTLATGSNSGGPVVFGTPYTAAAVAATKVKAK